MTHPSLAACACRDAHQSRSAKTFELRRFAIAHGAGLAITESPLPLPRFVLKAVLPKAALADAGLAWLVAALEALKT